MYFLGNSLAVQWPGVSGFTGRAQVQSLIREPAQKKKKQKILFKTYYWIWLANTVFRISAPTSIMKQIYAFLILYLIYLHFPYLDLITKIIKLCIK